MGGIVQFLKVAGGVRKTRHAMPVTAVHLGKVVNGQSRAVGISGIGAAGTAALALTERQLQVKAEVVIHHDQAVLQRTVAGLSVSVQRQGAILTQLPLDLRRVAVQHEAARTVLSQLKVVLAQIVNIVHGYPLVKGQNSLAHVLAHSGVCLAAALAAAGRQRQCHHQRQKQRRKFSRSFHHFFLLFFGISVLSFSILARLT